MQTAVLPQEHHHPQAVAWLHQWTSFIVTAGYSGHTPFSGAVRLFAWHKEEDQPWACVQRSVPLGADARALCSPAADSTLALAGLSTGELVAWDVLEHKSLRYAHEDHQQSPLIESWSAFASGACITALDTDPEDSDSYVAFGSDAGNVGLCTKEAIFRAASGAVLPVSARALRSTADEDERRIRCVALFSPRYSPATAALSGTALSAALLRMEMGLSGYARLQLVLGVAAPLPALLLLLAPPPAGRTSADDGRRHLCAGEAEAVAGASGASGSAAAASAASGGGLLELAAGSRLLQGLCGTAGLAAFGVGGVGSSR